MSVGEDVEQRQLDLREDAARHDDVERRGQHSSEVLANRRRVAQDLVRGDRPRGPAIEPSAEAGDVDRRVHRELRANVGRLPLERGSNRALVDIDEVDLLVALGQLFEVEIETVPGAEHAQARPRRRRRQHQGRPMLAMTGESIAERGRASVRALLRFDFGRLGRRLPFSRGHLAGPPCAEN
jgi:hypothetical protein